MYKIINKEYTEGFNTLCNITLFNKNKNLYVDIGFYLTTNTVRMFINIVSASCINSLQDMYRSISCGTALSSTIKDFYSLQSAQQHLLDCYGVTIKF